MVAVSPLTAVGMTAPRRRQGEADPGRGPAVRAEGAPLRSLMGVVPGALVEVGLVPVMGHPMTLTGNRERHVAAAVAAMVAAAPPEARTTTARGAATTKSHPNRSVAAQEIRRGVRLIPHATLEGRRKVIPS